MHWHFGCMQQTSLEYSQTDFSIQTISVWLYSDEAAACSRNINSYSILNNCVCVCVCVCVCPVYSPTTPHLLGEVLHIAVVHFHLICSSRETGSRRRFSHGATFLEWGRKQVYMCVYSTCIGRKQWMTILYMLVHEHRAWIEYKFYCTHWRVARLQIGVRGFQYRRQ